MLLPSNQVKKSLVTYRIESVSPHILAVVIAQKYDRAMTFCRVQEFYESPSSKFHGKAFSMWNYMQWYNEKYGRGFSYGHDWSGFNIPSSVAIQCMEVHNMGKDDPKFETPYDQVMHAILGDLDWSTKYYLIGTGMTFGGTFQHEICHGRYHTEPGYRKAMDKITAALPPAFSKHLVSRLREMGYGNKVIKDEIQAYMQYGYDDESFLNDKERQKLEKTLKRPLKYYHLLYRKASRQYS